MVNYKDLGLVNTREMFAKAIKAGMLFRLNFTIWNSAGYHPGCS